MLVLALVLEEVEGEVDWRGLGEEESGEVPRPYKYRYYMMRDFAGLEAAILKCGKTRRMPWTSEEDLLVNKHTARGNSVDRLVHELDSARRGRTALSGGPRLLSLLVNGGI